MTMGANAIEHELTTVVHALRLAFRDGLDPAFVLDTDGRFLMANPVLCQFLQVDEESLLGRQYDLFSQSTDAERVRASVATALGGSATRYRASGTRLNGEPFITEVTLLPLRLGGQVVALAGTAADLSLADAAADAQRNGDLLRLAGRIARFGAWSVDADSQEVQLSESARDLLEIDQHATDVTAAAWAVHDAEQERRFRELLEACLTRGEPFDVESEMRTSSGGLLWVRAVGEPERRSDGVIVGARGAILDVSAARAARERERALESRLTATLASIADGILFVDEHDQITYANPRAIEMSRLPESELFGTPIWLLFPDAIAAGFRDAFARARTSGGRVVHRALLVPYGRWFETTAYPTTDGLAVYLRDVTEEQAAAEDSLRAQERLEYQAALLDTARDAMLVRDLNGTILYWNRAAAELYGWSPEEAIGRTVGEIIVVDPVVREQIHAEVLATGYYAGEVEQRTRDGRTIIADCRLQLLYDDGVPSALFAVNSDITDWRREVEARQRAQRLESLGTLAGGIAHDLNNVLTPILMSVQLLGQDETDPERRELLATVETAVKRGAEMIRQVLTFARGVDGRRVPVDVGRLLDDLLALTRDVMPRGVEVVVRRAEPLPAVTGDPTQLLQVLVNLVTNARDAMGDTGKLSITAEALEIVDEYTSVSHAAAPGHYLQVSVEDSGHGMTADVVAKIFEPFYTTKPQGRGTGLGLATSLAIVRSHGGFMQVYSEPGRGTRFVVGIPLETAPSRSPDNPVSGSSSLPRGSGEAVLVVDDEEAIRSVTQRTLEAYGYRVITATDGREAIDIIERGDVVVDLVLTDMMMPVMDGAATSAYLEEHHPDIPIIAASGLNSGGDSSAVGMGIARFIGKPYTTMALLTSVSDTLREHRLPGKGDA
jgi:PAS domain S-box-containing protein